MLGCTGLFDPNAKDAPAQSVAPGSFPDEDDKEEYQAEPRAIYLHGHAASRLFKTPGEHKLPVCVAATTMQGIVLALTVRIIHDMRCVRLINGDSRSTTAAIMLVL
jgi:calcineurin-like phosphoesterase family protein